MKLTKMVVIREICRLLLTTELSFNEIARLLNTSSKRVSRIKKCLDKLSITWPEVEDFTDRVLFQKLYPKRKNRYVRREPNWLEIHELMRNKHQTLIQLWEEYRLIEPANAYSYSQFTCKYSDFLKTIDVTMRMVHYPGEVAFVDFAGLTIPYYQDEGEKEAQVFIGISGCSNYTFAFACRDQSSESWIDAHNKMVIYFDGVHLVIVPDNLKAAVTRAGAFPLLNRVYLEWAQHNDTVIAPARVRHPQDKSKAEAAVLFVSRWITAPLRRRKFFSLEEINLAISEMLPALNERKFKRLPGTRHSRFLEFDRPALKPLPAKPFEHVTWVAAQKVGPDYHVFVEGHAYSVPYETVGKYVEACFSVSTVQLFHDGARVAIHKRSYEQGGRTLDKSHMTKSHQAYMERHLSDFINWAQPIGEHALFAVEAQFEGKPHYSYAAAVACDKLKRLCSLHGPDRFEAACARATRLKSLTVKTINSILTRKLESMDAPEQLEMDYLPLHQNVRGSDYYAARGNV